jgi:hypothetical protein
LQLRQLLNFFVSIEKSRQWTAAVPCLLEQVDEFVEGGEAGSVPVKLNKKQAF